MPGEGRPPATGSPRVLPGSVVADKYVVEEVLGWGAMGVVVSGRHKLIGQKVAIKLIKSSYVGSPDARARFDREARALVAIESENVVRVFDYGVMPDDSPYLVMEYLTGRDLARELKARRTLPVGEATEIVLQACEGLAAAHARGIVHRDIKPANLFLTRRANGKLLVKIVDFGISKAPKGSEDELALTKHAIGSPHYMSPEQLKNLPGVDARSDVWSLGVTLYRALTGELPFVGESAGTLMAAVISDAPRHVRAAHPDVPAEVDAVVDRCLQKDPQARFASAQELADALAPFAMPTSALFRTSDPSLPPPEAPPAERDAVAMLQESTSKAHVVLGAHEDGAPEDPVRQRRALTLAIAAPLAAVFVALGIGTTALKAPDRAGTESGLVGAPAPGATMTDVAMPKTSVPEAAAAYQAGIQAVHDASYVLAKRSFDRAAALDPTMAAAELRAALYGTWLVGGEVRKHARAAVALRATMSEADRALLTAVEPLYLPPRPDTDEARRRMKALVDVRPRDTELALLSAVLFLDTAPREEVLAAAARALTVDPKLAAAHWLRSLVAQLTWDVPGSLHAVDECVAAAPAAASCIRVRATMEDVLGECAALQADAERMVSIEEDSYRAYDFLALALFARGGEVEAVRDTLRRKWRSCAPSARAQVELVDEAHLAIARGDFEAAMKDAVDLDQLGVTGGSEADRRAAALLQIALATETQDLTLAADVADKYLRRATWATSDSIEDDPRPLLYAAAARGGRRTVAELESGRRDWLALWTEQVPRFERARVWMQGYAEPASTREDAEAALAKLPGFAPLPELLIGSWTAPDVGLTYALAGRAADALPELRRVTTSCHMLADPLRITRTELALGQGLEAKGNTVAACDAYRSVLVRWGGAKKSVTAAAARARLEAMGCDKR